MKKNCSGDVECELTGGVSLCTCKMQVSDTTRSYAQKAKPLSRENLNACASGAAALWPRWCIRI